jgi:Ni2+-binding GTPase involved in maturation of urease and hydrogenase
MAATHLILVGGFLGAGKTTLLGQAAKQLLARNRRVGLITNDQADDLVDTSFLRQLGLDVSEIAGGCFCCRFGQLVETADALVNEMHPDVIISEPVGSCTDISATVLQPIKDLYADRFTLTPFSVLVDPDRLWEVLEPRRHSPMHASARYILRKQLEEADLIVLNKVDGLSAEERDELIAAAGDVFPAPVRALSALTGEGVAAWLDEVLAGTTVGERIVEVDYDIYAEGEAVLGWLNATVDITARKLIDWRALAVAVLDGIRQASAVRDTEIAHAKVSLTTPNGQLTANLTSTQGEVSVRGAIDGSPATATLTVNARVEMTPEALQGVVEDVLATVAGSTLDLAITAMHSLSPGRPTPTHRYTAVVPQA